MCVHCTYNININEAHNIFVEILYSRTGRTSSMYGDIVIIFSLENLKSYKINLKVHWQPNIGNNRFYYAVKSFKHCSSYLTCVGVNVKVREYIIYCS